MDKRDLIKFENKVKKLFLDAQIKAPVHLSAGNECQLIKLFKKINKGDWVFSTHRSHYHALLHGIKPSWLLDEILAGRSMHVNCNKHKFITSSIVCGCVPIAVGVAMAIKAKKESNHVWCFVGDMASTTGIFNECTRYSAGHNLPITFIVEDNGLSTNTPTYGTWGDKNRKADIIKYSYVRGCPHINIGQFVVFK